MDLVYADISIYNWHRLFGSSKEIITHGPYNDWLSDHWCLPRHNYLGMLLWRKIFYQQVKNYLSQHSTPDLVHAHTYLGGWVAAKIKENYRIPYVITEHSTAVLNNSLNPLHKSILETSYSSADKVLAVSESLAKNIKQDYPQVELLHNFIDIDLFKPIKKPLTKGFNIVCVGDLIERKQVNLLIEACHHLEINYQITIVGDGPNKKELNDLSRSLDVNIIFTGRLTQQELAQCLTQQDLLVHPSKSETFGLVLIEAMSCGLPVISFDNGGAADIITEQTGLLLKSQNAKTLASSIEQIYNYRSQYNSLTIRDHVIEHFSVSAVAASLQYVYHEVLSKSHQ